MNSISFKLVTLLLGLSALTVVSSSLSVRAETPNTTSSLEQSESSAATIGPVESAVTPVATVDPLAIDSASSFERMAPPVATTPAIEPAVTPVISVEPLPIKTTISQTSKDTVGQPYMQPAKFRDINTNTHNTEFHILQPREMGNNQQTSSDESRVGVASPIPGTVETSASALRAMPKTAPVSQESSKQTDTTVAQTDVQVGRTTQGGYSYIAVGGNIGLVDGNTSLGDGGFAVTSKLGLTRNVSFRPGAVIGDQTVFLIPVTYDFVIQSADPFAPVPYAPYLGGGVSVSTNGDIGFLVTGGVDVPLSSVFVANAAVNASFGNDTDLGIFLGVGYRFANLFR